MRSLLAFVLALGLACSAKNEPRVKVVTSTSDIAAIVAEVGGGAFAVRSIAPASLCPGHFDLRPDHIVAANQAALLLNHGWEIWFPSVEKALAEPGPRRVTLATRGNWMIPDVHKQAVDEVAGLLAEVSPKKAAGIESRAKAYKSRIDSAASAIRRRTSDRKLPILIAAEKQAPFLSWLGFGVAATFGSPEYLTAQELVRLAAVARDSGVGLFVDNIQSGPDATLELARSSGAKHVNLTNFPDERGYLATLAANVDSLLSRLPEPVSPDTLTGN